MQSEDWSSSSPNRRMQLASSKSAAVEAALEHQQLRQLVSGALHNVELFTDHCLHLEAEVDQALKRRHTLQSRICAAQRELALRRAGIECAGREKERKAALINMQKLSQVLAFDQFESARLELDAARSAAAVMLCCWLTPAVQRRCGQTASQSCSDTE